MAGLGHEDCHLLVGTPDGSFYHHFIKIRFFPVVLRLQSRLDQWLTLHPSFQPWLQIQHGSFLLSPLTLLFSPPFSSVRIRGRHKAPCSSPSHQASLKGHRQCIWRSFAQGHPVLSDPSIFNPGFWMQRLSNLKEEVERGRVRSGNRREEGKEKEKGHFISFSLTWKS